MQEAHAHLMLVNLTQGQQVSKPHQHRDAIETKPTYPSQHAPTEEADAGSNLFGKVAFSNCVNRRG